MSKPIKVLVVDDSEDDAKLALRALRSGGFDPTCRRVQSAAELESALASERWDVVISDFRMPGFTGMDALRIFRSADLDIPFILISGTIGEETAVQAMKAGASDYIMKRSLVRLAPAVEREMQEAVRRAAHRKAARELVESEAGLHHAQRLAKLAHVITGPDGAFESWPEALPQMIGVDPDQMPRTTRKWLDIVHPEDRALFRGKAVEAGAKGARMDIEYRLRRTDGAWLHIRQMMEPLPSQAQTGGGARWFNTLQDITEQKGAETRIKRLNRVYAVLSRINTLIVRVQNREQLFSEACRIAVEAGAFGMAWIGVVDKEAGMVKPVAFAGDVADFFESAPLALTGEPGQHGLVGSAVQDLKPIFSNDARNDPQWPMTEELVARGINSQAVIPLILGGEAIGVLALHSAEVGFFDAEEMRLLQELAENISFAIDHIDKQARLDYFAYYDALTGLANRRLFLERVGQYIRIAASGRHKLALYLIDLERFKNINDSLGRPAGDALLRQVAEWLKRNAADTSLLARVGADHFAIVLPEVKLESGLAGLLEKLMESFLEHPFALNDAVFRIAFKVGVALFPDDGADADTLFKNAEAALKKAKAGGDRYLFYTQKMTEMVAGRLTLENQLRRALDKEEFVLHYQPKVSLASGKVTGVEALIRWNDPSTGLVAPTAFIPVLEETGLIHEVGRWALRKAIEDYLRWRNAGLAAVPIAVNVSPLQLRNRGFTEEIRQAVDVDVRAAAGLELEITESVILEDVAHNIASLRAIRAMGVTIAIDDFGTGFSSLSYLAKLPVDTLKIDRSFVIDMTTRPEGLALVSTIITLARSLKLKAVAEGVETDEQSRLLRSLNCDEMQGYLFSKPVPRETLERRFLAASPPGDSRCGANRDTSVLHLS